MLTLFFAAVSLLYATVGQAGGTAFLALMAFASFPSSEMRPTALLLNIVAAMFSTWLFNRGGHIDWARLKPLLIASLPTALIGGFVELGQSTYDAVTGWCGWRRPSSWWQGEETATRLVLAAVLGAAGIQLLLITANRVGFNVARWH